MQCCTFFSSFLNLKYCLVSDSGQGSPLLRSVTVCCKYSDFRRYLRGRIVSRTVWALSLSPGATWSRRSWKYWHSNLWFALSPQVWLQSGMWQEEQGTEILIDFKHSAQTSPRPLDGPVTNGGSVKINSLFFIFLKNINLYIFASLSSCLFVSNKRQNGWTSLDQIWTSHDPREGLFMVLWKRLDTETDPKVTFGPFPSFFKNYRKSLKNLKV